MTQTTFTFTELDLTKLDLTQATLAVSLAAGITPETANLDPILTFAKNDTGMEHKFMFGCIYQIKNKYLLLLRDDQKVGSTVDKLESEDFIYLLTIFCNLMESYIHLNFYKPLKSLYHSREWDRLEQKLAQDVRKGFELALSLEDLKVIAKTDPKLKDYCSINTKKLVTPIKNKRDKYRISSLLWFENPMSQDIIYFCYTKRKNVLYLIMTAKTKSAPLHKVIEIPKGTFGRFELYKSIISINEFVRGITGDSKYYVELETNILKAISLNVYGQSRPSYTGFEDSYHVTIDSQTFAFMHDRDNKQTFLSSIGSIFTIESGENSINTLVDMLPLMDKIRLYATIEVLEESKLKLKEYLETQPSKENYDDICSDPFLQDDICSEHFPPDYIRIKEKSKNRLRKGVCIWD